MAKRKREPARTGESIHVYVDPRVRRVAEEIVAESRPRTSLTAVVELALIELAERMGKWPPKS